MCHTPAADALSVPCSLRHAAVSTWLRTTGDAALVARWAGHSVHVLLTTYAKAVHGAEQQSLDPILERDTPRRPTGPSRERIGTRRPYFTGWSRSQPDQGDLEQD